MRSELDDLIQDQRVIEDALLLELVGLEAAWVVACSSLNASCVLIFRGYMYSPSRGVGEFDG